MASSKAVPKNLTELLRAASVVWAGKSCLKQFYSAVEEAIRFLGEDLEVSSHQVAQYRAFLLNKGLKESTVNQKLVNLCTVLKYGKENKWVSEVPKFVFFTIEDARTRILTNDEELRLLVWFNENGHEHMAAFVELLVLTGCRCNEILSAKKRQIEGNYLRLEKTKNGKSRTVPLVPRAKELADQWIPMSLTYDKARSLWVKARKALELDIDNEEDEQGLVMHSLRHTAATRLLQRSQNIKAVKELLGHATFRTSERYAKMQKEDLMSAMMS